MARKNKFGWLAFDQSKRRHGQKKTNVLGDKENLRENNNVTNKNS